MRYHDCVRTLTVLPARRIILIAVVILACSFALNGCSSSGSGDRQAVFLIVVDTLRPDRLSCHGYDAHETPHIDALAQRGVRFTRAQSVASWTVPSMGSMMTSLYPTQLGLVELPGPPGKHYQWQELRDQADYTVSLVEITLAEIFHEAGYRTAAFVDQPGLIESGNFFQGFDEAFFPSGVKKITRFDPDTLEYPKWAPFLRHAYKNDLQLIIEFAKWLAERQDQRLFVWLHLLTPHWPYDPPAQFMANGETARTDDQKLEERFYNGEVRATDDLIGRITEAIDDYIGIENAVVVFTSDHGEGLGEHGMHDHGHSLHAEVLRVPLIMTAPSLPKQRTVDVDVRTIDIMPTILDLVGIEGVIQPAFEGTSLVPMIDDIESTLPVFSEAMLYGSTERSLSSGEFKLMFDEQGQRFRLFDVSKDPAEIDDVAHRHPERTDRLRDALATIHDELVVDRQRRAGGEAEEPAHRKERMLRALRALGYVR